MSYLTRLIERSSRLRSELDDVKSDQYWLLQNGRRDGLPFGEIEFRIQRLNLTVRRLAWKLERVERLILAAFVLRSGQPCKGD